MRILRTLTVFVASSMAAATFAVTTPSAAFANGDTTTSAEVTAALDRLDGRHAALIDTAVSSTANGDSAAQTTTADIPIDPTKGVKFKGKNGQTITIGLPNARQSGRGTKNSKGAVIYSGRDGTANVVVPADRGAQFLTTITSKAAPTKFDYPIGMPRGSKISLLDGDAGAIVYNAQGQPLGAIAAPWAKDANGKDVKTYFTTNGKQLTQHVDHRAQGVVYPVVADPRWIEYQWWGTVMHLTNWETRQIGQQAQWLMLALGWAYWIVPAVIGAIGLWATGVADRGRCMAIVLGTSIAWEERC